MAEQKIVYILLDDDDRVYGASCQTVEHRRFIEESNGKQYVAVQELKNAARDVIALLFREDTRG